MKQSARIDVQIIDQPVADKSVDMAGFINQSDVVISAVDSNEIKALDHSEQVQPAIILLNYQLREELTPEYIGLLAKASPTSKVIVTGSLTDSQIIDCLMAGAQGYLDNAQMEVFADKAITAVNMGEAWVSRQMLGKLLNRTGDL